MWFLHSLHSILLSCHIVSRVIWHAVTHTDSVYLTHYNKSGNPARFQAVFAHSLPLHVSSAYEIFCCFFFSQKSNTFCVLWNGICQHEFVSLQLHFVWSSHVKIKQRCPVGALFHSLPLNFLACSCFALLFPLRKRKGNCLCWTTHTTPLFKNLSSQPNWYWTQTKMASFNCSSFRLLSDLLWYIFFSLAPPDLCSASGLLPQLYLSLSTVQVIPFQTPSPWIPI